ncbi:MAG: 30S ribosomal protein S6 [Breznakia sp.]
MKKYEIMYIVNASLEDATRAKVVEGLHKTLTDHKATIDKVDEWGAKAFAYEINHMRKGYYYVINVTATNEAIEEFNRLTRINTNVIRFLVVKTDEEK